MKFLQILKPFNLPATIISLSLATVSYYLIFNKMGTLPPEIPLWYSKAWGPLRLATPGWLWLVPSSVIIVLLVNQVIAKLLDSRALILIITWSSVVFGIIISFSLIRILLLIT